MKSPGWLTGWFKSHPDGTQTKADVYVKKTCHAHVCVCVWCVVYKELIQYYDYIITIFEVLIYTFLLIL